jgi:predicted MPP superfamily phosphohydrolase
VVQKVNKLDADIVVITGDLIDTSVSYGEKALSKLKDINSKYGTYFIVGNHEYFHNIEQIISSVKSLGITVLENSNLYIGDKNQGFNLAGVYDIFGERYGEFKPDIDKALDGVDKQSPTILLAHQPLYANKINTKGIDLILSGHTHGGQIYPFRVLVKLQQKYISGLYQHNKTTQLYINRGTGFWGPPMRLGSTPEISCITIKG